MLAADYEKRKPKPIALKAGANWMSSNLPASFFRAGIRMSDTTLKDCIICEEEGDCIEGICSNCAAEDDLQHYMSATSRLSKKNLKLQKINKDLAHELEEADKIIESLLKTIRDRSEPMATDLRTAERKAALAQAVEDR